MNSPYLISAEPANAPVSAIKSTLLKTRGLNESARKIVHSLLLIASFVLATPTIAAPLVFDFNGVTLSGSASNGLGATGNSAAIATDMNNALTSAGYASSSVTVTGALATKTYNGEGHVTGQTLGTSEGGVLNPIVNGKRKKDTFIINDNFGLRGPKSDRFTLTFTNFLLYSLQFDWEIFPDATCPANSSCAKSGNTSLSNWPDISLLVDGSITPLWEAFGPTSNATTIDPQALGVSPILNLNGAKSLTFVDWPAEIGIDNLRITGCVATQPNCLTTRVPEPGSLALLCLGLFCLAFRHRQLAPTKRIKAG
jgi:hypothetical protein